MERRIYFVAAVIVVIIAVAASVQIGVVPPGGGGHSTSTSTCSSCAQGEPVVDVVMPVLGSSGNFTNPNRILNFTQGETRTFEVDVYPTKALGFAMGFDTVLAPGSASPGTGWVMATFQPTTLSVGADEKGASYMTVKVAQNATKGTYDVVVSVANLANGTEVWGLYFEIAVS